MSVDAEIALIHDTNDECNHLLGLSVDARVAAVLLRWADAAAAARQTVSSTLRKLEELGVIRLKRRRIEVLDYDGLAEIRDSRS